MLSNRCWCCNGRTYLRDLVESTHLFMKMLEKHCTKHSHLVVQRKKKMRPRTRPKKKDKPSGNDPALCVGLSKCLCVCLSVHLSVCVYKYSSCLLIVLLFFLYIFTNTMLSIRAVFAVERSLSVHLSVTIRRNLLVKIFSTSDSPSIQVI